MALRTQHFCVAYDGQRRGVGGATVAAPRSFQADPISTTHLTLKANELNKRDRKTVRSVRNGFTEIAVVTMSEF